MNGFAVIAIISAILLFFSGIIFWYQASNEGCADEWVEVALAGSLVLFMVFGVLTGVTYGFKTQHEKNGPDYEKLDNYIAEIIEYVNEDVSQNSDKFKNEWTKETISLVDKYNTKLTGIYDTWDYYELEVPAKLTTYQHMEYNYYENVVYWEDGTLVG